MRVIIGNTVVLQASFRDSTGVPIAVTNPIISIFYYTGATKTTLVNGVALTASSPSETGRYVYVYAVPDTFVEGDLLYVEMSGTDPLSSDTLHWDFVLELVPSPTTAGMSARFI